jgi:hypothetical protein
MDQLWSESAAQQAAHRYQANNTNHANNTNEDDDDCKFINEHENDMKRARIALGSLDRDRQKLKQQLNEPKYNSAQRQTIAIRNTQRFSVGCPEMHACI